MPYNKPPVKAVPKEEPKPCSRCKRMFNKLTGLDAGTKEKLMQKRSSTLAEGLYCKTCLSYVMNEAYSTVLEKRVKIEQDRRKAELWQSRIKFLKQGKNALQSKNYIEAVKNYSSYIMVLEKVLDLGTDELAPEYFRTIKGEKEKGVVALVYFDLLRIYDRNEQTYEKFSKCIEKIRMFSQNTKEVKNIVKALDYYINFSGEAIHKKDLKKLFKELTKTNKIKRSCFIATAVYRDAECYEVRVLRFFRDHTLLHHSATIILVDFYYKVAPFFAKLISTSNVLRKFSRVFIDCIVKVLERSIIKGARNV